MKTTFMRGASRTWVAVTAASAVAAGLGLAGSPAGATAVAADRGPKPQQSRLVAVKANIIRSTFKAPPPSALPKGWVAPAGGEAVIPAGGGLVQAGGYAVRATPAATRSPEGDGSLRVAVRRGGDGMLTLALADKKHVTAAASKVGGWHGRVTLQASQLAPAAADASARLSVFDSDSGQALPVVHGEGQDKGTLSFDARVGATYAVAAAANGSTGSFGATGLSPASSWGVSEQSGSFTWSQGFRVPPAAGGVAPSLNLAYDSGSVDGRVASTNNQPSWVGEGFELSAGGFISREYVSCSDDMSGGSNASRKTSDLCWGKDNATLVLNGKSTRLIKDAATGTWRLKNDDGSTLVKATGAGNDDKGATTDDGEYWVLTDTSGTKFYFGLEKRYPTDTVVKNSTLTVPVNGNHSGEPCYNATFASGFCDQAWRWNLSYVQDVRGNTASYTYKKEPNRYGQNLDTKSVAYDRGGYLTQIDYGQVAGSETEANTQQRVIFEPAERCLPSGAITCAENQLTQDNAAYAAYWPDVPQDQICTATTTCGASHAAPAFFTRKRLVAIRTQVMKAGTLTDVERWDLAQSFPQSGDGTSASLQLDSVKHTGKVGASMETPAIQFGRTQLANRVDTGANDGDKPLIKWRVNQVKTEAGGVVTANYKAAECTAANLPSAVESNTKRCYPNFWIPPGALNPVRGWFHKYVVDSLVEDGSVAPSKARVTRYNYIGSPAWHYDDAVLQPTKYRTWSDFRGYDTVDTLQGEASEPAPTRTRTTFYRGMDGDRTVAGGTRPATVKDSTGATQVDADWFAGMPREAINYNGAAEVDGEIRTPWASTARATDATGSARIVRDGATVRARQAREDTTPYTTETVTSFDALGNPTQVSDKGDVAKAEDDRCTTTTYVANTAKNLQGLVATNKTTALACGATPGAGDIANEMHTFYDGATATTTTPSIGAVTKTMTRADTGMVTSSAAAYDARGRVTSVTDVLGATSTTVYTPTDNQPTTQTVVTDPHGFATTTLFDPAYGVPTKVTDANNRATTVKYDPLGRTKQVWLPNRSALMSPSMQYDYQLRQDGPSSVTSSTLHYMGSARIVSTQLLDGLLRPVQSQTQSGSANRVITESVYDTRGLQVAQRGPWVSTGLPGTTAVTAADVSIDSIGKTVFDGAARTTRTATYVLGVEKLRTDTIYRGDSVDTIPPTGGVATRSVLDARGRQTELWQYHGSVIGPDKDVTKYTFDNKDQLTKVTSEAGVTWAYGYNQLGHQISSTDPDKGSISSTYDLAGNVLSTTDARGQVITRTYDTTSRPLTVKDGVGALLNSWTYDTVPSGKGKLASASSFNGAAEYKDTVNAYNSVYDVTGNNVTIPPSETGLGGTYTYTRNFNVDGSLGFVNMPAVANLPAEQYGYQRDATNLAKNLSGNSGVVEGGVRDGFGRLTQYVLGSLDVSTTVSASYETGLGRLSNYRVDRDNVATPDIDATYSYDPSGRITSIADVPDPATTTRTDRQCFQYTWAGELSEAWSNGATSCAATPSYVASGASPYWTSWTYDNAHRRASQIQHTDAPSNDTTRSYTYPAVTAAPDGTNGGPHAARTVSTRVGAAAVTNASLSYDLAGNTRTAPLPSGGTGTATWDALGRYATQTKVGVTGATSHVYDATGSLLIRKESSGKKTLFLGGDTEVTYTPVVGSTPAATTAKRVFTFEGQVVAFRDGPNPSDVTFQPPGYQGTSLTQVDGGGGSYAVRRFDPFGAPRGPVSGASWETQHGFLGATGATTDVSSGLVHLGAREYDPTLGRFLSVDPVMKLTDPQQWNAYGYANNNPVTYSDPTGLAAEGPGAGTIIRPGTCGCKPSQIIVTNQSQANSNSAGGGNGAHRGNGGNSNTGGQGGQGNANLGGGPSQTTANDRAGYETMRARQAIERAAARAAASRAQSRAPKQSWSLSLTLKDLGFGAMDLSGEVGGGLDDGLVRVSGYQTAAGASVDPYLRWKAKNYAPPGSQLLRSIGVSAKSASRIAGPAKMLGRLSMIAGPISSGYDTYAHDSLYDQDPTRSVGAGSKAIHVINSMVFNAAGTLAGGAGGGYVGGAAGFVVGGVPGAAAGTVAGVIGFGYAGGSLGTRAAIEVNYSLF